MATTEIIWDKSAHYLYQQTEKSVFDIINGRYHKFLSKINDVNSLPVSVFDQLSQKQLDELELIREVTKGLQKKKDDDIRKQNAEETTTTDTPEEAITNDQTTEQTENTNSETQQVQE